MTTEHTLPAAPLTASEEARWVALGHLSGLFSFVGPLVVWLVYRDRSDAVERESKEALNAQITLAVVAAALSVVGAALMVVLIGAAFLLAASMIQLVALVFAIIGTIRARSIGSYRYPFALRFVR